MLWRDLMAAVVLIAYYLVICAIVPMLFKLWLRVPDELVRKTQHMAYTMSVFLLLHLFSSWYAAVLAAALLIILAYPVLMLLERTRWYGRMLVDRRPEGGELRMQLLYVQASFAFLIFVFWGVLGTDWRYLVAASVMAWGYGDAAAALVGKAFGKTRVASRFVEGAKTLEGTTAMIVAAAVALFITLTWYGGVPWFLSLPVALLVAPICGVVELFSRRGVDTLTVPFAAAAVMLPVMYVFGLLRWIQ